MGTDDSWLPCNRPVGTSELRASPSQHSIIIPELTPEARSQKKLQDLALMIQKQKDQLNQHEECHRSVVNLCDEFMIQIRALQQQVGGLQTKNDFYENQMQELKQKVGKRGPCYVTSLVVPSAVALSAATSAVYLYLARRYGYFS